jgi:pyocin large subunit-like protein
MGVFSPNLDKKKRKYRRTAKRLFQQLVEDHDFKGSERSVRQYVSKRKKIKNNG